MFWDSVCITVSWLFLEKHWILGGSGDNQKMYPRWEKNHSQLVSSLYFYFKYYVNTQIGELIIKKHTKKKFFSKTSEYLVHLDLFHIFPVENVSFVFGTQGLPWKLCFLCISFLTINYCLCGFHFCQNYFELIQL